MILRRTLKTATALVCLVLGFCGAASSQTLKTPAEDAGFARYSQAPDIGLFLSRLDAASESLAVSVVGRSAGSEAFPPVDLWLCALSSAGAARPGELDRTKPTILITASQHGNEHSAKEAALELVRDVAAGPLARLLESVNLLVLPQANPHGNFFDVRPNAQGLDLNRDHVKVESDEVRAIHAVFAAWRPEVTLDVHEKGDDFYRVSLGCVSNLNIDRRLQEFSRGRILAAVGRSLAAAGVAFHEYLVTDEMGVNTAAGAALRPEDLAGREEMMRFSTTDLNDGRNSLGIYQTLSFIQEGASRHDLATLRDRTRWQAAGLRAFVEAVAANGPDVLRLVGDSRAALGRNAADAAGRDLIHLRTVFARDPARPTLTIKAFERSASPVRGVLKVDKKAGEPLLASDIAPNPAGPDRKVVEVVVKNWFPEVAPVLSAPRPAGYLIPSGRGDIVENLLRLGVEVDVVEADAALEVEVYRVDEIVPAAYDYLAPEKIEVMKEARSWPAKRGDYFVSCGQPAANLVPMLLEPQSEFGFIRYWKYRLVPAAGDLFEIARLARLQPLKTVPFRSWSRD